MPFGIVDRTASGIRHVLGLGDRSRVKGTFDVKFALCSNIAPAGCGSRAVRSTFAATRPSSQITLGRLVSGYDYGYLRDV